MPRLGTNLEVDFELRKHMVPKASVYSLGIKILAVLECVHETGFVFNDLKLDNLMVEYADRLPRPSKMQSIAIDPESIDIYEECTINLVDYGFASTYLDETKKHLPKAEVSTFRGNLIFGSLNQLYFNLTSRRDDLISLCYLLIYMLNRGNIPGIEVVGV